MSDQKIEDLLAKGTELLEKVMQDAQLDQLQKAQVVQTLMRVKLQLEVGLAKSHESETNKQLIQAIDDFGDQVDLLVAETDWEKVQAALENLGTGVDQLIKRTQSGASLIKE